MKELIVFQDAKTEAYSIRENNNDQPHCWLGPNYRGEKFCFELAGDGNVWETKNKQEAEKWLDFLKHEMLPNWVRETYHRIRKSFPYDVSAVLTSRFEGRKWVKDTYGNWYRQSDDRWTMRILSKAEMSLMGPNGDVVRMII